MDTESRREIRRSAPRALLLLTLLVSAALAGCAGRSVETADRTDAAGTAEPPVAQGVVFLARHAETEGEGEGRWLSEAGRARAEALADRLEGEPIERVFSTDYRRTRETAAPIAERLGLELEIYDPRDLAGFAESFAGLDQTVLVVGHSNTTPALVEFLGGAPGAPIDEATEHDRLYRVDLVSGETVLTRFGE